MNPWTRVFGMVQSKDKIIIFLSKLPLHFVFSILCFFKYLQLYHGKQVCTPPAPFHIPPSYISSIKIILHVDVWVQKLLVEPTHIKAAEDEVLECLF